MEMDLREFFSYPVPRAAWQMLLRYQGRDFAEFIEGIMSN